MPKANKPQDSGILFKLMLILVAVIILLIFAGGFWAYNHIMSQDKEQLANQVEAITKVKQEKDDKKSIKDDDKNKLEDDKKSAKDEDKNKPEDDKKSAKDEDKNKPEDDKKSIKDDNKNKPEDDKKSIKDDDKNKPEDDKKSIKDDDDESKDEKESAQTNEDKNKTEEIIDIKPQKQFAGGGFNLGQLVKDLTSGKPAKAKKGKGKKNKPDPLNQMPDRHISITSPFAQKDEVINVPETSFNILQKEAVQFAGRKNPFIDKKSNSSSISLQPPTSNQNIPKKTGTATMSLPEIPDIPDNITLPPELTNIVPPPGNFGSTPGDSNIITSASPQTTNAPTSPLSLERTYLTGIIGNSAVLNFGNESRALHVGQNYKGVVVLSITDKTVTLELDGKKVIKELRDRF